MDKEEECAAVPCGLTVSTKTTWRDHTCRDDANMKWRRLQSDRGIVLTNACLLLGPSNQTVQYFTKHAIPTYTHHTGKEGKLNCWKRRIFQLGWYLSETCSYPSKPIRSFFRRWSLAWFALSVTKQRTLWAFTSCLEEHPHTFCVTYLSRESWYQPAQTEGPPENGRSSFLSFCLQMG